MVLKYYAHPTREKKEVLRDLSKERILSWEIYPESRLGYKGGNLSISFDIKCSPEPKQPSGVENRGGVYPPIPDILNYNEVMDYLRKNFSHLERGGAVISPSTAPKTDTIQEEKKITFGTRLRKLFN